MHVVSPPVASYVMRTGVGGNSGVEVPDTYGELVDGLSCSNLLVL